MFKVMTIAGSDSGAGAGVQADLKTFAALGVYGTSVVTAVTAQNTEEVAAVHEIPPAIVSAQIDVVLKDIGADAVKTGMLSSSAIIEAVADSLKRHGVTTLVVDPVMVSKSGDRLLRENAVHSLRTYLLPMATVVTPNVPEAEILTDMKIRSPEEVFTAARRIVNQGVKAVVVKGGHLPGPAVDRLYDGVTFTEIQSPRIETNNTHGTGCTLASAMAVGLAKGLHVEDALRTAKEFVTQALLSSYAVGHGHSPLNHFFDRAH